MAELPALPLWTDAYLADTGHLTTIEHGAYLLLLMAMWRAGGSLPNDDKRLARFCHLTAGQWARIRSTLMEFFQVKGDTIIQGRLTDELEYVRQHRKKQSDNARSKYRKTNDDAPAVGVPNASQNAAPIPTPIHISSLRSDIHASEFDGWYSRYPNKVGKGAAKTAYEKARKKVSAEVLTDGLSRYLAKTDDRQWCNPSTWLHQERWADEPAQVARGSPPKRETVWSVANDLLKELENAESAGLREVGHEANLGLPSPEQR